MKLLLILVFITLLDACSFVPGEGPLGSDIEGDAIGISENHRQIDYSVIELSVGVINKIKNIEPVKFSRGFSRLRPKSCDGIGVGDLLDITIFEAGPDGVFSTSERKQTNFKIYVTPKGDISVPYVGNMSVANKSIERVQKEIRDSLKSKALEPDVLVQITQNNSCYVSIDGSVKSPRNISLRHKSLRILDAISISGGIAGDTQDIDVMLIRGGRSQRVSYQTLLEKSVENIRLGHGDRIILFNEKDSFISLGAVENQGEIKFDRSSISLLEAIAKAKGLNSETADAKSVFVFRFEDEQVVRQLSDVKHNVRSKFTVPVIYKIDMGEPQSYFIAQKFKMRDGDLLYVANSPTVPISKLFGLILKSTSTYGAVKAVGE